MSTPYAIFAEAPAIADATAEVADKFVIFDVSAGKVMIITGTQLQALFSGAASAAEIARVADVSTRIVPLAVSTAITEAAHDGRTIVMGGPGAARTFTLPAATGSGARFRFVVGAVNTSNYLIKVADATDTMDGSIVSLADGGDTVVGFETAADSDTITLNGTTTGGVSIGDFIQLEDIATDQWAVHGRTTSSGTEATPFSATVT